MAQSYYIRGGGYVQGPLDVSQVVERVASGSVEPTHEIAEVPIGIKPSGNHYIPAHATPFWEHRNGAVAEEQARLQVEHERLAGIVLTTEVATDLLIQERLGIITAECAYGMNLLRDLFAGVRDVVGGRSGATQNVLRDAKDAVLTELKRQAFEMGADAVVAVDLDYTEFSGGGKAMLVCVASGTAVKLKRTSLKPQAS